MSSNSYIFSFAFISDFLFLETTDLIVECLWPGKLIIPSLKSSLLHDTIVSFLERRTIECIKKKRDKDF